MNLLPHRLSCHDSTRATIAFFSVSGIDVLDSLDLISEQSKQNIIDWIYGLQVIPKEGSVKCGGFQVKLMNMTKSINLIRVYFVYLGMYGIKLTGSTRELFN